MSAEDAIGVTCAHRWATLEEQRKRLKEDGCRVIINLGEHPREYLLTTIRDGRGTTVKLAYAFLLADLRKGARDALADYRRFTERIAGLPRKCHARVKDLETGLVADTPGKRKAMLAVVKEQLARHGKGRRSAENGKRGRVALVLTELQETKGEAIWRNLDRYPHWKDAEKALQQQVHKGLTQWSANRRWKKRRVGAKRATR